jgi:predicted metalloendopeptidase
VFAGYDGIKFDASIGIGEDMADISGLAICEEYLRDYHFKNDEVVPVVSLSFRLFLVYFAVQQRQHIYKNAIKAQLKTNPHPMDKYRTNVPVSRLKLFRSIFDIKKEDKMYWHTTNKIW